MDKKKIDYFYYYYCLGCDLEFASPKEPRKTCIYCKRNRCTVVLSDKIYTKEESYRAMKEINEAIIKAFRHTYLTSDFDKKELTEKKVLNKLARRQEIKQFWEKNINPSDEEYAKFFKEEITRMKKAEAKRKIKFKSTTK